MVDGVILIAIGLIAVIGIFNLLISVISNTGGTKGIEDEPYYGRKTGKVYTAKKERSNYIV